MNNLILKKKYHIARMLNKVGMKRQCLIIMHKLKDVDNENVSTLAYQYIGQIFLDEKKYSEALDIYKESLGKLENKHGDGFQCYGAVLSLAAYAALELKEFDLVKKYLDEMKSKTGFENWILDRIDRLEAEVDKRAERGEEF